MRLLLASIAALACGCRFEVPGFTPDGGVVVDGGVRDAAMSDGSTPVAFTPSHVAASDVAEGAASLAGMMDIDTDALAIDGRAPPPGVLFHAETSNSAWAVLAVHDFTVTSDVTVHGSRALVVIAVGTIEVDAVVHAEAKKRTPGPGGDYTGMGVGSDGKSSSGAESGGGGAGHATAGATGGDSTAKTNGQGGAAGSAYGSTNDLVGGSGGGAGSGALGGQHPCPNATNFSAGGAGGGTIQLSAKVQLRISPTGGINAGGGGGLGGCEDAASAGGGGGSGGTVWLEAPSMTIDGKVSANGGGGGSGGASGNHGADGAAGLDGLLDIAVASGGTSGANASGAGGAGGASTTVPASGGSAMYAGGGGGAVGTLRIRTHAVSAVTSASTVLSPAPLTSVDF